MPDLIHRMPEPLANQIAAGEVIQRPASVVKELMENSIDAGATTIDLIIEQSGKALIRVIDDGIGMTENDAAMAFEKHATSKIETIDDLFSVQTKGFRGEALASIAAIAQVTLTTRQEPNETGTEVHIAGSEIQSIEPCTCPTGTSIAVKNLFFNVPARRQFLKSDSVERKHILDEFTRIVLAHPEIAFSLVHNGNQLYQLKEGNYRQRVTAVLGDNMNNRIIPIQEETEYVKIEGFIGKPEHVRKTRGHQYLFANRRFFKSNSLSHAVYSAYRDMIPTGRFPFFVVYLTVDPNRIDINVHPTKQEIKFSDEKLVYSFVNAAVRHALARFSVSPTLDFEAESGFDRVARMEKPPKHFDPRDSAINQAQTDFPFSAKKEAEEGDWRELYEIAKKDTSASYTVPSGQGLEQEGAQLFNQQDVEGPKQLMIQGRYMVSPIRSGYLLIDVRAAQSRILYERLLKRMESGKPARQQQLFPQTIEVSTAEAQLLKENTENLEAMGFDVQPFGGNTFVIQGLPADVTVDGSAWITSFLDDLLNPGEQGTMEERERWAWALAKHAAQSAMKNVSSQSLKHLADELFACSNPYNTPTGRKTFVKFTLSDIEKQFNRTSE